MNERERRINAVKKLKKALKTSFGDVEIIVFGSLARNNFDFFSDIDVVVLIDKEVNNEVRKKIFEIAFNIGLEENVLFGVIVKSKKFWKSRGKTDFPLFSIIEKEGITI